MSLKIARLEDAGIARSRLAYAEVVQSKRYPSYQFIQLDLEDNAALERLFQQYHFTRVIHLAAQAGVRYSIKNPAAYIQSNVVGFANLLEACRRFEVAHLVYASSSSVYGLNQKTPFSTQDNVDHPVSLYAATKKSNELMAHTYSHLFKLPTTGLRFFTVYGPWGRPDMAYHLFARAILAGEPIQVFNHGNMSRDFTYIDDIVEGVVLAAAKPPQGKPDWNPLDPDPAASTAPYRVYNIGAGRPMPLLNFILELEQSLGKEAIKEFLPMQAGDVESTFADISGLQRDFGYNPAVDLHEGIQRFVQWYLEYYR